MVKNSKLSFKLPITMITSTFGIMRSMKRTIPISEQPLAKSPLVPISCNIRYIGLISF